MPRRKTLAPQDAQTKLTRFIGTRIIGLRKRKNWTKEECAIMADMTKAHLSQIESGKRVPSMMSFMDLLEKLQVDAVQFFLPYEKTVEDHDGHYHDFEAMEVEKILKSIQESGE